MLDNKYFALALCVALPILALVISLMHGSSLSEDAAFFLFGAGTMIWWVNWWEAVKKEKKNTEAERICRCGESSHGCCGKT